MRLITLSCFFIAVSLSTRAQDDALFPADKPETGFIEESQNKEIRLTNLVLPQEIAMQDNMRSVFTDMMERAASNLGWQMREISEYTNDNAMQGGGTPYATRSPRGITITFQFIVNNDSLEAWKNYENNFESKTMNQLDESSNEMQSLQQSPEYLKDRDSANYYMNLYTAYCEDHKAEGVALYTVDKHPKYYQTKERDFLDKANALVQQKADNSGIKEGESEHKIITRRFRNHTVVQVEFVVNAFEAYALNLELDVVKFHRAAFSKPGAKVSTLYTIGAENQDQGNSDKWNNILLILLGNFQPNASSSEMYHAGFEKNGQGDEHTPKKVKSDKLQNIAIDIYGDLDNVTAMSKYIDLNKLNALLLKG
ncbi:MAG: hypothetical protein ABI378_03230 [Chitinophagaceae bacterium]